MSIDAGKLANGPFDRAQDRQTGKEPDAVAPSLEGRDVEAGYHARTVLHGLSIEVAVGEIVALVGPNGSGKSTLLRTLGRVLRPRGGAVLLDGRMMTEWPTREVARRLALLPQGPTLTNDMNVEELVWLGRSPHQGILGLPTAADHEAVRWAINETRIEPLLGRQVSTLSGGERQRVWLAMALAQKPQVLLLDEPTTFLDLAHQLEVLDLIRYLNQEHGLTVVMVLHDLNQAARYAGRVVVLRDGSVYAQGRPADVLTLQTLREVFGVDGRIMPGPDGVEMVIVAVGRV
ncbi:MAG TPA: ABC transporter ATP-binding protein [Dehalococcoidia bacterium]|nr:ABC transporter ATP-binding protein [Dehalococcoidia bacterium]